MSCTKDVPEPNDLAAIQAARPDGPRKASVLSIRPRTAGYGRPDKLWDRLDTTLLRDRIAGAWLGRAAGCTLGAPVEGWDVDAMARLAQQHGMDFPPTDYWAGHPEPGTRRYDMSTVRDYLQGNIRGVPVDDDLTYTLLGLLILEEFGPEFTTDDVAAAWLKYLPMACTAEHVALENLKAGVPAA